MQLLYSFVILASALTSIVGALSKLDARQSTGSIYLCTEPNWTGECSNLQFTQDQCQNFPLEFQKNVSSAGPDAGWVCNLFVNPNCDGSAGEITDISPGYGTLPSPYAGNLTSLECYLATRS